MPLQVGILLQNPVEVVHVLQGEFDLVAYVQARFGLGDVVQPQLDVLDVLLDLREVVHDPEFEVSHLADVYEREFIFIPHINTVLLIVFCVLFKGCVGIDVLQHFFLLKQI